MKTSFAACAGAVVLRFAFSRSGALLGLLASLSVGASTALAADWTWNTALLYQRQHDNPQNYNFTTDWVTGSDGTGQSLQITEPSANEWNYFLDVPRSYLTTATNQFRAVLDFEVVTPTVLPQYFWMFARCLDANGRAMAGVPEQWQRFVSESADGPRRIEFPIEFPPVAGGTWHFYFGCKRTGTIIIDSLAIKEGWDLTREPAVLNGAATSVLPAGVSAATGSPAITISPPASGTVTTLTASDLVADGATPVTSAVAAANSTKLQAWLTTAKNTAGTKKLAIPPGTYRFESSAQLNIDSTNDLTIDGQGATFIFQKLYNGAHFMVNACNRLVVKNLNMDWNSDYKPIASLGRLVSLSSDKKTAVFQFDDQDAAQTLRTAQAFWHSMHPMDTTYLYRNSPDFFLLKDTPQPALTASANQITAVFTNPLALTVGTSYCIKHLYYEMIGFKLAASSHVLFDTVNFYGVPGMGWLNTEESHHLKWTNCKFLRRAGSRQPLITGADGIHSGESKGDIAIQACTFTGLGDDAINLHDNCWQGGLVNPGTGNQLQFRNCPRHQLRVKSGDVIRFYNTDYTPAGVELTVTGTPTYSSPNGDPEHVNTTMTVTFAGPVPASLSPLSIANNTRFETKNVRIAGNTIMYTNGRGVLLSAKNATIDSCYFRNVSATSIQITTEIVDTAYMEGRGASNVLVSNNTFENTNQISRWAGAVVYVGATIPWGPADVPLFTNLTFDNNKFYNSPGPAISLTSTANVIVKNSRIEYNQALANVTPFAGTLQAVLSDDLALGGNTWRNVLTPPNPVGTVYNPSTVTNLAPGSNRLETP